MPAPIFFRKKVLRHTVRVFFSLALMYPLLDASKTDAQVKPIRIAIVDGRTLSYPENHPKTNHEKLEEILQKKLSEKHIEVNYFDIGLPDDNDIWIQPSDIITFKPVLVIIHFSSFGSSRGVQFCRPFGRPHSEHCSQRLLQFMNTPILVGLPDMRFMAYSRAGNLCRDGYLRDLNAQIEQTFEKNRFNGRLGIVLFTKASGRGLGFVRERAQRDINNLVRHLIGLQAYNFLPTDARDGLCMLGQLGEVK